MKCRRRYRKTDFDKLSKSVAANGTAITQTDSKISLKADRTEVQTAKATADSAVSKGQELERKINQTNAELRVTADSIAQKVSRVDLTTLGIKLLTLKRKSTHWLARLKLSYLE